MTKLSKLLLGTTCFASLMAASAFAQTSANAESSEQNAPVALGDSSVLTNQKSQDKRKHTDASENEVIVTGTRIFRPNNQSAAPITSISKQDIQAQGALTIEEVINRLPQFQANAEQNYAASNGVQRIKLRNLGFERTLTLIDGLRIGLSNGQDVSIIPNAIVERVDVLSGGASSVYGSEAVAGVVNFILKKNFEGLDLTGNYSFYNHNNRANVVTDAARSAYFPTPIGTATDGGRLNVTMTVGRNFFDERVNVSAFVNYRHSDIVPLAARSYSACEVTQSVQDGPLECSIASFTPNGTIIPLSGSSNGQRLVNNPNGSRSFVPINSGPGTAANPYDGFSFQREFNRINAGTFLTAKFSDHAEIYSTLLYYRDRSRNPQLNRTLNYSAYGDTPYMVNCDNPFLSAAQANTICGNNAGNPNSNAPIDLRYRFDGLPPADDTFQNEGVRVTGGVRGKILGNVWHYDVAGVYTRNTLTSRSQSIVNFDRLQRSLQVQNRNGIPTCKSVINGSDPNCIPFDAFRAYNNDAALNKYLYYNPFGSSTNIPRLWQFVATLSGDLGKYGITSPFAEQGVAIAVGAEYRSDRYASLADAQYREANGGANQVYTQTAKEANIEAQIPLVEQKSWAEQLQLNVGYRRSKYSRLNNTFGTWKVESIWMPIPDIAFRGSINKSQRAPNVNQASSATNIYYDQVGSRNDPCAPRQDPKDPQKKLPPSATLEQCRNTGLPDNLYGSDTLICADDACTIRNGGFGLKPESAYTKTFGVVLQPRFLPGLTLSADRFLIDLKDSISYFAMTDFLNGCLATGLQYYCRGVKRNPGTFTLNSPPGKNPTTGYVAQGLTNGYRSQTYGWDFQAQYELSLGSIGRLNNEFNGSLATKLGSRDAPEATPRNCVGYYGPFCGESLPRWKHGLRTTWISPSDFALVSFNWRHISGLTITYNADPATGIPTTQAQRLTTYSRVPAYDYIDFFTSFDIAKRFSLQISVNNLFDRDPPLVPNSRNTLGLLQANTMFDYDLLGRQIVVGASVHF